MSRRLAVAALIVPLAFSAARAGPMMPPGSSPEAGFAGVWRIIAAKPAPWVKQPKLALTRKDVPLLEFVVEFAEGEVKGPPPLSCSAAKYSSGVTYRDEAFGGALAGDKDGRLATKLRLGRQISTYRVICGSEMRDFYNDDDADLVMLQGDIVYMLERPAGMDPQQYKAGYSGPSFDCAVAKTTGERLICNDAALSKSDKTLGEAYGPLRRALSAASFATFVSAERAWLNYVMEICGANVPMPETPGARGVITECLTTEFNDRVNLFTGLKAKRAGAGVLEPRMRFRARVKARLAESDIYPWMNGGSRGTAFNAFVFKTLMLGRWRMDDKDLFRTDADFGAMRRSARRVYIAVRFDNRIVSFQVSTDDFTGGNHDILGQGSFTWDLAKARLITLEDIFAPTTNWKAFVAARCREELHKQFSERNAPDLEEAEIADALAESRNWVWGPDQATVIFVFGSIAGMTGGEFDVDMPLAALKPYMKNDAPVR